MLLCLNSVAVSLGILMTYGLNIYFDWRTIGIMFAILSFITFLLISKLPESPNWIISLSQKRKLSNAISSIQWIYRDRQVKQTFSFFIFITFFLFFSLILSEKETFFYFIFFYTYVQLSTYFYHQLIDNERLRTSPMSNDCGKREEEEVEHATVVTKDNNRLHKLSNKNESLVKVLFKPQVYKPLIILLFVFMFQQFSGCYILIFYTINILRNLSLNFSRKVNENMALMLLGMLRLIMSVIASGYESLN